MAEPRVKIVTKKVRPYPFPAILEVNSVKKPVEVIYLGQSGVIVNLSKQIVSVGEYYQIQFSLPVKQDLITAQARVLKTYDKNIDPKVVKVERLAELHFQSLTKEQQKSINAFLVAIGQAK